MTTVAALIAWSSSPHQHQTLETLHRCEMVTACAAALPSGGAESAIDCTSLNVSGFWSHQAIKKSLRWFSDHPADHLLMVTGPEIPLFNPEGLRRMTGCIDDTGASIVYGDYYELLPDATVRLHPLIDYQPGSIRDTFDFGPAFLINGRLVEKLRHEIAQCPDGDYSFGGLYDLRLRLSERGSVQRLSEPLYTCISGGGETDAGGHFAYVDPRNRSYQREMERIASAHLERIGALIAPPPGPSTLDEDGTFPVEASIIIPVKNRVRTVGDAVKSALSQKTTFPFNVIVVDNHSTDGTTDILKAVAGDDSRMVHHIPERIDLLIGGCWNEAVFSANCGRYAVQLDSDDLYSGADVLETIIAGFRKKPCALVIGSYTTVTFNLEPLAPGLVDHREWTDENGPNNALRIAGLGAPRAYHVPTLRRYGFPNVSYGEDYAVVLRLCRSYPLGRIYESLYWCRRWEENSDSSLPPETANRYDAYKDRLRSIELAARLRGEA